MINRKESADQTQSLWVLTQNVQQCILFGYAFSPLWIIIWVEKDRVLQILAACVSTICHIKNLKKHPDKTFVAVDTVSVSVELFHRIKQLLTREQQDSTTKSHQP